MASVRDFSTAKAEGRKLVMATAYDAGTARLLADTPIDALLVGDSVMMVVHGESDTLGATIELMTLHTRAVTRGRSGKLVVADMPFLAGRKGKNYALDCAAALLNAGAHAVKIEGVRGHAKVVEHLVGSGIPVMGHLGLTPQSVRQFGGFTVQARKQEEAAQLKEDALAFADSGAFALVLECIPAPLARQVTSKSPIPTIGIGAGKHCDGQILVINDLLGLTQDFRPRFVRTFSDGAKTVRGGVTAYARAVRNGSFPKPRESF